MRACKWPWFVNGSVGGVQFKQVSHCLTHQASGMEKRMAVDTVLRQRESAGRPIRVGMVGAGATGRAIALQLATPVPGFAWWRSPIERWRMRSAPSAKPVWMAGSGYRRCRGRESDFLRVAGCGPRTRAS